MKRTCCFNILEIDNNPSNMEFHTSIKTNSYSMKTISLLAIITLFCGLTGFGQPDKKEVKARQRLEMAQLIESGHFRFVARSAHSDLGNFNNLSATYDVIFENQHIKAFLPYFGRAYSSPYGSNKGGVKFDQTAEKLERKFNERKKMYSIFAEVKDDDDSYSIHLTAGLDGYADLKINFVNRQWISYYGTIEKPEEGSK